MAIIIKYLYVHLNIERKIAFSYTVVAGIVYNICMIRIIKQIIIKIKIN